MNFKPDSMAITTFKQKIALILFGLFLGIILLEAGLRMGGFVLLYLQERANQASLRKKGEYVILCLGESTTALGGRNAYPRQLEDVLNERNTGIKFSVINKGIAATDTTTIVSLLEGNLKRYKPNMVITMIGINDHHNKLIFKDTPTAKFGRFLENCRVYKLARLLREHIILTLQGLRPVPPDEDTDNLIDQPPAPEPTDDFIKAEARTRHMIQNNPDDPLPYIELGDLLRDKAELEKAERFYRKAEGIAPELIQDRYDKLTQLYFDQGNFKECIRVGEKAIEFGDKKINLIVGDRLSRAYLEIRQPGEAERICKMILKQDPRNDLAWCHLGDAYYARGNWREAEQAFRKAVELQPSNIAFTHLMFEYVKRKQFKRAEELGRGILSTQPDNIRMLGALAFCYQVWGKQNLADEYYDRIAFLQSNAYKVQTIRNYQKIKEILDNRKIQLVCVQYPMRCIKPLKNIFKDQEKPIFVDNETVFKDAVRSGEYTNYFKDNFAGDFGHCTRAGNRLLAENIAGTLWTTCFKYVEGSRVRTENTQRERGVRYEKNNLLISDAKTLTASSQNLKHQTVDKLIDSNLRTFWHISLERVGQPAWVTIDFGEGNEKKVRSLAAFPREDIPQQFFRNASLFGSNDKEDWKLVSNILQEKLPESPTWREWKFANNQAFRYYKLLITSGHEDGPAHHFYSMAELALLK